MPNTFTAEGNLGVNLNNLSTKDNNRLAKPAEGGEESRATVYIHFGARPEKQKYSR